jgi:hypothetical protein
MKPSLIRYFFGHGLKVSMCFGSLALAILVAQACGAFSIWTVIAVLVALPLGCILGALFLWPFIFQIGSKVNGAPFQKGELVHILNGRYRDKVGHIYEIWKERNSVLVDLGEETKKDGPHEFSYNEICRERDATRA